MNRITIMSVMAALALIMAPGFAAQAATANPDTSPDTNIGATTASDIETLDTEVEDDAAEVEDMDVSEVEDMDVSEVEDMDVSEVGDVADGAEHGD